jgi:hypothetical protein
VRSWLRSRTQCTFLACALRSSRVALPVAARMPVLQLDVAAVDFRYVEGEVVALESRTDEYLSVTGSGVALWRLLEVGTDRPAMVRALTETYDVDADRAG